jgi:hypothetical protein
MLADYRVREYVKRSAGRRLAAMQVVYPYRKFVNMDPQTYQWDYESITLKRGCKLKLDWDIPVNTGASAESRGVAMSRISGTSSSGAAYLVGGQWVHDEMIDPAHKRADLANNCLC